MAIADRGNMSEHHAGFYEESLSNGEKKHGDISCSHGKPVLCNYKVVFVWLVHQKGQRNGLKRLKAYILCL